MSTADNPFELFDKLSAEDRWTAPAADATWLYCAIRKHFSDLPELNVRLATITFLVVRDEINLTRDGINELICSRKDNSWITLALDYNLMWHMRHGYFKDLPEEEQDEVMFEHYYPLIHRCDHILEIESHVKNEYDDLVAFMPRKH